MTETIHEKSAKNNKKLSALQKYLLIFAAGLLVAFVVTTAVRFALIKNDEVHYHALFSRYITGQEDPFKSFTFYDEVATCDVHAVDDVKGRAHMHDQNGHMVHVHAHGVSWGAFFANLGYTLGDNLVKTDNGVYVSGDDGNKLTFLLNGKPVDNIANTVIKSEDVLLINYGKDNDSTLKQRYDAIPRDAHKANVTKDPAACSGQEEMNFMTKFKQALGAQPAEH